MKSTLLDEIIEYYLNSGRYNGMPIYEIEEYDIDEMSLLIKNKLVEAISEKDVLNPHIRGFALELSIEHQIENAKDCNAHTCFYPTEKALNKIKADYKRPYSTLMQQGKPQFDIIYFDIEILERYNNNPKFLIMDNGYRGTICVKDEYYNETEGTEYIKDYGMAYIEGESIQRAVGVFVIDLARLSPRIQMMWKGFELENQEKCKINKGFVDNLLKGIWVTDYWIFHALLEEMKIINDMCKAIDLPKFFMNTYGTGYNEMPEGYRNILLPTMKNYYDFVLVLEKMIVNNISIKVFQKESLLIKNIERKDEKGVPKGSLVMMKEWLLQNVRANFDIEDVIIAPLKEIRKIRQVPAHELTNNTYELSVYDRQNDMMLKTYEAIRALRMLFMGHPMAKGVAVPEYLLQGDKIVFY